MINSTSKSFVGSFWDKSVGSKDGRACAENSPPVFVNGVTSPYVTFHRSKPVLESTLRTLYSVRPTNTASRNGVCADASAASRASSANVDMSSSSSRSPSSHERECITTLSAVNVRNSVPSEESNANTTLVRVPSTKPPSRVMLGDASTSCRTVTGRRVTTAFVPGSSWSPSPAPADDSDDSVYKEPSTPGNTTAGPPRLGRNATDAESSRLASTSPCTGAAVCARTKGPPEEKLHSDAPVSRSTACTVPSNRDTSRGEAPEAASKSPLVRVTSAATHVKKRSTHGG